MSVFSNSRIDAFIIRHLALAEITFGALFRHLQIFDILF
jgi:hypothetical protein